MLIGRKRNFVLTPARSFGSLLVNGLFTGSLWFPDMKRIDAIIRPQNLDSVKEQLAAIGVEALTIAEVRGFGRQKGHQEFYRGAEYAVDFIPKLMLTILAADDRADEIVKAIIAGARTGKMGDGKIFVTPLDEVVRIRTGEIGDAAI